MIADMGLINDYMMVGLTMGVYYCAVKLQRRCGGNLLLNPILISIVVIVAVLTLTGLPYSSYENAGNMIMWWMQPAIVALAWPLCEYWDIIRREALPIVLSQILGAVTGILSVIIVARLMGGSDMAVVSMASKSVTMPIALAVSESLGGELPLTSIVVIFTGLLGALTGGILMTRLGFRDASSRGLAIGAASHAIGTAACYGESDTAGVYSTIAMILNGVITAWLAPWLVGLW